MIGLEVSRWLIVDLLVLPAVVALFGKYLALSMLPGSTAQKPEHLFKERGLLMIAAVVAGLFVLFTFVDVPALESYTSQQFISIHD